MWDCMWMSWHNIGSSTGFQRKSAALHGVFSIFDQVVVIIVKQKYIVPLHIEGTETSNAHRVQSESIFIFTSLIRLRCLSLHCTGHKKENKRMLSGLGFLLILIFWVLTENCIF